MQAHDDPELRARVRAELLYPTKPKPERIVTARQLVEVRSGYRRGKSIVYLSQRYGIPESVVRDVVGEVA